MNFKLSYKEKSRILNVRQVKGLAMGIGLTFKSRNTEILLFDFGKLTRLSITSFFVFFPFLAVWLDGKNRVIEKRVVQPFQFRIAPKKGFRRLIEIPINSRNAKIFEFLDEGGKV